jgi:hypothetical protein
MATARPLTSGAAVLTRQLTKCKTRNAGGRKAVGVTPCWRPRRSLLICHSAASFRQYAALCVLEAHTPKCARNVTRRCVRLPFSMSVRVNVAARAALCRARSHTFAVIFTMSCRSNESLKMEGQAGLRLRAATPAGISFAPRFFCTNQFFAWQTSFHWYGVEVLQCLRPNSLIPLHANALALPIVLCASNEAQWDVSC